MTHKEKVIRESTVRLADSLRLNVKEVCEAQEKSLQTLCMDAGITPASVYLMLAKGNPRLSSLEQLADILGTPVSELLQFRENAPDYTGPASLRGGPFKEKPQAAAPTSKPQAAAPKPQPAPKTATSTPSTPVLPRKLKFSVKQG